MLLARGHTHRITTSIPPLLKFFTPLRYVEDVIRSNQQGSLDSRPCSGFTFHQISPCVLGSATWPPFSASNWLCCLLPQGLCMFRLRWLKNLFFPAHLLSPPHWAISSSLSSELESLPSGPSPEGPLSLPPATIRQCRSFCIHRYPFLRWEIHIHSCNYLSNIFVPDHLDCNSIKATMEDIVFVHRCGLSLQCNPGPNKLLGESVNTLFVTIKLWDDRVCEYQQETWCIIQRAPGEALMSGGRDSRRERPCFPNPKFEKKF